MKRHIIKGLAGVLSSVFMLLAAVNVPAQEKDKAPLVITIAYFSCNNSTQYVTLNAKSKATGKFQPVAGAEIQLYLNKDSTGKGIGYIGKFTTNDKGNAVTNIPPSLAAVWKSTDDHTFIATAGKTKQYDEAGAELVVTKAKITIDTADDKNVTATLSEYKGGLWLPVKGVDVKLGIKRLGGDLQIGDDATYTTDSLGHVTGELKKMGVPGDKTGNIVLVAKVEDNDQYGNLRTERAEPWGKKAAASVDFFHRALWASRFHSPVWLVVIAYSIILTVWGVVIYLIYLLIKIKKLGREAA